jgi:hypothetical protein
MLENPQQKEKVCIKAYYHFFVSMCVCVCRYRRSYDSEYTAPLVNHHIWPALMQGVRVVVKGEAHTRRGASLVCMSIHSIIFVIVTTLYGQSGILLTFLHAAFVRGGFSLSVSKGSNLVCSD